MAFLRMGAIFEYLNCPPDSHCVTKGEEILSAKQLIMCGLANISDSKYEILALCLQTSALTDKPHEIKGRLLINKGVVEIDSFSCSCKAGLSGVCKHVSACLFYCNRNDMKQMEHLTTTDLECYCTKNKNNIQNSYGPKPINKYSCLDEVQQPKLLTAEEHEKCLKMFRENKANTSIYLQAFVS